jgi:hypothetical protein
MEMMIVGKLLNQPVDEVVCPEGAIRLVSVCHGCR